MFAIISLYVVIASLKTDVVLAITLFLTTVDCVLVALGNGMANETLVKAGGYTTIVFAVLVFYHAASDTIFATFGKDVLPVGRLRK